MFSVIIPLYNKESFIKRTIASVLAQEYQGFEVLVVNDGSVDKSVEVVRSFKDERVKLVNQENSGVSAARNRGMKEAKNEIIAFLDADDEWEPDYLLTMSKLIGRYPECSMFASARYVVTEQRKKIICKESSLEDFFIVEDFCKDVSLFHTSAICIRSEIVRNIGNFQVTAQRGEDLDYWLRVACKYRIAYNNVPKTLYHVETENNLNRNYKSYKESIPYWDWYAYDYPNKASLNKFINVMILRLIKKAIYSYKLGDAAFLATKLNVRHLRISG